MKNLIARTFTSLMLVVMCLAGAAYAQSTTVIAVSIPFEFSFGGHTFPAGDYSITEPLQNLLVLRDSRGQTIAQSISVGLESPRAASATQVKFDYADGQHILTEVWQRQESSGRRLYPTKQQVELAKHHSTENRETAGGSQP